MATADRRCDGARVDPAERRQLCAIELIAEGRADRCPRAECAFWEGGCVLARVETALDGRPEVAALLLAIRRELEAAEEIGTDDDARWLFRHRLGELGE